MENILKSIEIHKNNKYKNENTYPNVLRIDFDKNAKSILQYLKQFKKSDSFNVGRINLVDLQETFGVSFRIIENRPYVSKTKVIIINSDNIDYHDNVNIAINMDEYNKIYITYEENGIDLRIELKEFLSLCEMTLENNQDDEYKKFRKLYSIDWFNNISKLHIEVPIKSSEESIGLTILSFYIKRYK